ncbi:uncharacterized protein SPPG_03017 [Spizellomyces punctatus DAOM BR117]|uniref:Dynactin subunit 4 n=1 Tax=Spizellomyces punctatus (strain DAOM BR117) TaxID=645134 RepID=A0A0L0HP14_SPIPD|nr:uncharacterized protein SPPG_03017 [Spizellomyces punctatus DAOM BR117]KND02559.1 hypothetical protein SPPG_03017 [Spizellomyces punctatus DAOM BR117]|eukprot:XP_016610598.1 hypothetical protein SPPG_03017 [Spizellomyces punctatus DAOM BR117]
MTYRDEAGFVVEDVLIPPPYVYYQCHCHQQARIPSNTQTTPTGHDDETTEPPRTADILSLFPISRTYYCDHCHQLRCPLCISEEIACYYCPNCLFEVPTASVKAEKNRCGRNCFECPECQNTLTVVSLVDPAATGTAETAAGGTAPATGNTHYLSCGACRWDSLEIGLQFERPTGLATQLQPVEEGRADVREFENLRLHFEKLLKVKDNANNQFGLLRGRGAGGAGLNLPSSLLASIPGLASLASFGNRSAASSTTSRDARPENYVPLTEPPLSDDTERVQLVREGAKNVTTLRQRMNQPNDNPMQKSALYPQRIQLRTKRSKRCRKCEHILVKPEQKAQSTRFKIKLMASHFIPTISIVNSPLSDLKWDTPTRIIMKFSNPLERRIAISLATTQSASTSSRQAGDSFQAESNCEVTVVAPNFTVDPAKEIWEYDEEGTEQPEKDSRGAASAVGIHERDKNITSILVHVTPRRTRGVASSRSSNQEVIRFPLLVTVKQADEVPVESQVTSANPEESSGTGHNKFEPLSFWVMVGLGRLARSNG